MTSTSQIRSTFLDYFKKNNHEIVPSSPLIPKNDPTLLFTNAGMVQFKDVFTGIEQRPYKKAASSQKCVRAGGKHNDLENVGYTARHHTFFEMLGNFSFGDYFKEEAISYAWDLITNVYGLSKDKLWFTVYESDQESHDLWRKITGCTDDRVIRISTMDNFWMMGETGPCGPCTEIFYDHGSCIQGGLPGTPEQDGDRYVEIWNLVFMQFESLNDGSRIALPKPCVDTGMGLERLTSILQGKHNNYDIDLFKAITDESQALTGRVDLEASHRVIADHLRSSSFLIADGVLPSNEGRGYVLRRIMRRAMRHAHLLGSKDPLMHRLVPTLVKLMGDAYGELCRAEALITTTLLQEEEKFRETLDRGIKLLQQQVSQLNGKKSFPGDVAFNLYDTYGFPIDLTQDILKSHQLSVDMETFNQAMEAQKAKARANWAGSGEAGNEQIWFDWLAKHEPTRFLGYEATQTSAKILQVQQIGDLSFVLTDQTPFYGESGGQVGDTGNIIYEGNSYFVTNTLKKLDKLYIHIIQGSVPFQQGAHVDLMVDKEKRDQIRSNHTATHLLHAALRNILGEQVTQKGSLVQADRLRFDFSYSKSLTNDQLKEIEDWVNQQIWAHKNVETHLLSMEEAVKRGAMALFGEKYEENVRVVNVAHDEGLLSMELCGGTHVHNTGAIGMFKILSENGISSGVRRIEAITQAGLYHHVLNLEQDLTTIQDVLKCSSKEIMGKIKSLLEEKKNLNHQLSRFKAEQVKKELIASSKAIKDFNVLHATIKDFAINDMKGLLDDILKSHGHTVVIGALIEENKASVVIGLSKDLVGRFDAVALVRSATPYIGGSGGGGRKDMAQGGGSDASGVSKMFDALFKNLET